MLMVFESVRLSACGALYFDKFLSKVSLTVIQIGRIAMQHTPTVLPGSKGRRVNSMENYRFVCFFAIDAYKNFTHIHCPPNYPVHNTHCVCASFASIQSPSRQELSVCPPMPAYVFVILSSQRRTIESIHDSLPTP